MTHTPGPFEQFGTEIVCAEGTPNARVVCKLAKGKMSPAPLLKMGDAEWDAAMEDAAFIVKACNSHEELVKRIEELEAENAELKKTLDGISFSL